MCCAAPYPAGRQPDVFWRLGSRFCLSVSIAAQLSTTYSVSCPTVVSDFGTSKTFVPWLMITNRSQTWKAFLQNHSAGIGAMGFLIVPTVGFRLLFVLVILRHQRRRLISLSVTVHPTADWIARQITDAFPWDEAPEYMIRDRDG